MTATLNIAGQTGFPVIDFEQFLPSKAATAAAARAVRNVGLFLAAPFIGLVYALAMPLVGLVILARIGGKAFVESGAARRTLITAKNVTLFAAAPLIGLVYAVLLPVVGMAMIAKIGYQAYRAQHLTA
jgi:hypothetical protein